VNIPKPLLVVIVIIIVLGVLSCGVGAIRGIQDANPTPAPFPTPTPFVLPDGVITARVPEGDVSASASPSTNCSIAGVVITVISSCQLTVDPVAFLPRKLFLNVTSGPVAIVVRQVIRGQMQHSDSETKPFGVFEISVSGSSPVFVDIGCVSCTLEVVSS
jgi:hypothetical protein